MSGRREPVEPSAVAGDRVVGGARAISALVTWSQYGHF